MAVSGRMLCVAVGLLVTWCGWCPAQEPDLAALIEDLREGELEARFEAAWVLSQMGEAAAPAVPALIEALADEDEGVRMLAACALGEIGPAAAPAAEALRRALEDADPDVAAQAQVALDQIGATAGPQPASTTGPLPASTTGPLPARTPLEPGTPAEPMPAAARLSQEELELAIQSLLMRDSAMGLLDDAGNQLNPNVPPDAPSLRPADVATHAGLIAQGHYRRLSDVTDFLAQFGATLEPGGPPITAEDLLPDLQSYVNWSYQNPEDPRAGLGLAIAGGAGLVNPPPTPPVLSPDTEISPVVATSWLTEGLYTGMFWNYHSRSMAQRRLVLEAFEEANLERGAEPDLRLRLLKCIVHTFEVRNRLTVRLTWGDDESARHEWTPARDPLGPDPYRDPFPGSVATPSRQGNSIPGIDLEPGQRVAVAATVAPWGQAPLRQQALFNFKASLVDEDRRLPGGAVLEPGANHVVLRHDPATLVFRGNPDPFYVHCVQPQGVEILTLAVEAELPQVDVFPVLQEYWPLVKISDMSLTDARVLFEEMIHEFAPCGRRVPVKLWGRQPPDLIVAAARGEYLRLGEGHYQVRTIVTVKNQGQGPSDYDGTTTVKLTYLDGVAGVIRELPGGAGNVPGLRAEETLEVDSGWYDLHTARLPDRILAEVVYTTADERYRETDARNNDMIFHLVDVTPPAQTAQEPAPAPPPAAPSGTPPGVREADLLGSNTIGADMYIDSYVHTTGNEISGAFNFWDRRPQHQQQGYVRIEIWGSFAGALGALNGNYQVERARAVEAGEGEAKIADFTITGQWKGEKWIPQGGNEVEMQAVAGEVRVTGYLAELHDGAYVARGKVCFAHAGEEEFTWWASAPHWQSELELARQRMGAGFRIEEFPWWLSRTR